MFDLFIPWVISDVSNRVSFEWVRVQNHIYEVLRVRTEKLRHFEVSFKNFLVELLCVLIFKRKIAAHHCVQNNTRTPDIRAQAVVTLSFNHFRSSVARAAARRFQFLPFLIQVAQAEVDELYVVVVVQKQIFRLQIAMHNAELMNVFYSRQNLGVHFAGFDFLQAPVLHDVLKKFAAAAVLHDEVQVVIIFNHLTQLGHAKRNIPQTTAPHSGVGLF